MISTPQASPAEPRWRAFAQFIAQGMSHADAYRKAGYKAKGVYAASTGAGKLLKKAEVRALVDEAVTLGSQGRILTAQERRVWLSQLVTQASEPVEVRDRISAIRELNAMDGLHLKKVELTRPRSGPIQQLLAGLPTDVIRARLEELEARKKP